MSLPEPWSQTQIRILECKFIALKHMMSQGVILHTPSNKKERKTPPSQGKLESSSSHIAPHTGTGKRKRVYYGSEGEGRVRRGKRSTKTNEKGDIRTKLRLLRMAHDKVER